MSRKQTIILLWFNFIALFTIGMSGIDLGKDIQSILHNIANYGIQSNASGRIRPFSYTIDVGGNLETIYNYLFIISLIAILLNIVMITGFILWNKRRK